MMKFNVEDYWHPNQTQRIGDGKFPNKYWVSWSNDYLICKHSDCDWASIVKGFTATGDTSGPFDTFKRAKSLAHKLMDKNSKNNIFSTPLNKNQINLVTIEDRLSGIIYEIVIEYWKDGDEENYELTTRNDTRYTKNQMEEKGLKFV